MFLPISSFLLTADCECADGRSYEGEGKYGADVSEEISFLHRIAGVEYYRRQQNIEEYFGIKCCLLINFTLFRVSDLSPEVVDPGLVLILLHVHLDMASLQIELVRRPLLPQDVRQLLRVLRHHIEPRDLVVVIDSKPDDGTNDQTVHDGKTGLVNEGNSPRKIRL